MSLESTDSAVPVARIPRSFASILIIDDDPGFRPAFAKFFAKMGFSVVEAASPTEGLRLARERGPGAIFLDLCLDGKNPKDTFSAEFVMKGLRSSARTRSVPVFVISGIRGDVETEARFRVLGAEALLAKAELFDADRFVGSLRARLMVGASPVPAAAAGARDGFPLDLTVLVIDDESDTADLLKTMFKNGAHKVFWADNGVAGLSLAKTELPDLVILDLHMPGLDGKQVCRRLRDESAGGLYLPILMLTGDDRLRQEVDCLDLGADDYLLKTAPVMRLAARVRGLIRRRRFGIDSRGMLSAGGVVLDCEALALTIRGRKAAVGLTKAEAGIVALLLAAMGKLVRSDTLHKKVCRAWPGQESTVIKVHVSHIRKKLGRDARLIESVNGEDGYRLDVDAAKRLLTSGTRG
ncbi:MAG: response regulator [Elusimicrobia bacterium]|nr:response regulator [Elusimicrobiota bacterium]MDE2511588.1 response regulator [Elusimicrobiota bacterium]